MSLGGFLSDNILCLLAYNEEYSRIIRNSITLNLYSGPHRIIASRCYEYLDRFNTPPKDHISDILEDKLEGDTAEASIYRNIILSIRETVKSINTEYVVTQIQNFVRRQSLRSIAAELIKTLQRDTEEGLDEAELLINKARQAQIQLFDPGTKLNDKERALKFLEFGEERFPTGIKELDIRGLGPARKELWLLIGDAKGGKSMALSQLAKSAIINRLKVVHITLEMSEGRCAQRYFQMLYSIAKRDEKSEVMRFSNDEKGNLVVRSTELSPKLSLEQADIGSKLEQIIDKWATRHLDNIFIKEFATGTLTVPQLEAYLDSLGEIRRFTPDLLIIDYPDLMKLERDDFRHSLDEVYKEIRGLAVKRNIAVAVVSQSNRLGRQTSKATKKGKSTRKIIDIDSVAESYSKVQHADIAITLTATPAEKRLRLARLYVAASRNEEGNSIIVISQYYKTGIFALDSTLLSSEYWDYIPDEDHSEDQEE